jgi:hypothetical protein
VAELAGEISQLSDDAFAQMVLANLATEQE